MLISVIIPVYNAAKYLNEAVSSALAQPEVKEVILVDDGSKDNSMVIAANLAATDSKIVILTHHGGVNKGSAETRNVGIRAAKFEYIAFIDADDWFLPNRFALTETIFAEHPDADGVYETVINVKTEKARSFSKTVSLESTPDIHMLRKVVAPDKLLPQLIDDPIGIILLQGLCVKKTLFDKTGLFDAQFRVSEDMLMVKKMASLGKLYPGHLTQPVSVRRIHDTNISFSIFKDSDVIKYLEAEVLLCWALKNNISRTNMNAITQFNYRQYFYRHRKPFNYRPLKLRWLISILINHPSMLKYKQFWVAAPIIGKYIA